MNQHIIYGLNALREALHDPGRLNRVYFAKESRAHGYKGLVDDVKGAGVRFDFVPQAKLNELTGTQEHQGVAAVISPVEYHTLDAILAACPARATVLALDQIQHPKNLGMLLRTAMGAGVAAVLLCGRGGALVDSDVLRASAGTALRMPLVNCKNLTQSLRTLRNAGFWIYGLDGAANCSVEDVSWPERCVLVVGNETKGLRPGVLKVCDETVSIRLDNDVESLNAAVATGIALFRMRTTEG